MLHSHSLRARERGGGRTALSEDAAKGKIAPPSKRRREEEEEDAEDAEDAEEEENAEEEEEEEAEEEAPPKAAAWTEQDEAVLRLPQDTPPADPGSVVWRKKRFRCPVMWPVRLLERAIEAAKDPVGYACLVELGVKFEGPQIVCPGGKRVGLLLGDVTNVSRVILLTDNDMVPWVQGLSATNFPVLGKQKRESFVKRAVWEGAVSKGKAMYAAASAAATASAASAAAAADEEEEEAPPPPPPRVPASVRASAAPPLRDSAGKLHVGDEIYVYISQFPREHRDVTTVVTKIADGCIETRAGAPIFEDTLVYFKGSAFPLCEYELVPGDLGEESRDAKVARRMREAKESMKAAHPEFAGMMRR